MFFLLFPGMLPRLSARERRNQLRGYMAESAKGTPMAFSKPVSLWRNRDYLLLWSGQTISNVGTGVSTIAYPLLVLAVTGSPAQAGFISAVRALIYALLCLSFFAPLRMAGLILHAQEAFRVAVGDLLFVGGADR
jgi:hypothetical protein